MNFNDDEYQFNLYTKLLNNWEARFKASWKSARRYIDEDQLEQIQEKELNLSSASAKRIYMTLNKEKNSAKYMEMFGYLAKRTPEELQTAEQLLPEFENFLKNNQLNDEEKLRLKTVFPHIAGSYHTLYHEAKDFPSFTEFLEPFNNILQNLEQNTSYYSSTVIFDKYMSDYYNVELDQKMLTMKLSILSSASKQTADCRLLNNLENDFSIYSRVFPETIHAKFLENYIKFIIPRAVKKNDIFGIQSNKWGCARGKGIARGVGAATFAYKCYATNITPRGINDLLQMSYEVLGGNLEKHEKIRKDALLLNYWFPRDPIHDSVPGINEIIDKMVAYYDAPLDQKENALFLLEQSRQKVHVWKDTICDLQKYDEINPKTNEKNIDILRRINDNMSAHNSEVVLTENEALNKLSLKVHQEKQPLLQDMIPLVAALNKEMLSALENQQTGFSPEMVHLIARTDRKLARTLNQMDFEKQMEFYKSNACYEVLKFSELTHNASETFNQKSFDEFYEQKVKGAFDMEEAYQNIASHQNHLLFGLYKQYDQDCHAMDDTHNAQIMTEARKERAGSGNTLKALQNLTLYKDASTRIGTREKQEREERFPYRQLMIKAFYHGRA